MGHPVKLVKEVTDKMYKIIAIARRVIMIQETKLIAPHAFKNAKHVKLVQLVFLARVISDKMLQITVIA
jgi:hypothetical protein